MSYTLSFYNSLLRMYSTRSVPYISSYTTRYPISNSLYYFAKLLHALGYIVMTDRIIDVINFLHY